MPPPTPIPRKQLSRDQQIQIYKLCDLGLRHHAIAIQIGRTERQIQCPFKKMPYTEKIN